MISGRSRLGRVASDVDDALVLILDRHEIRWVSGFCGSTGRVVLDPAHGRAWCIVDGRYVERARLEVQAHGEAIEVVALQKGETHDEALARVVGSKPVAVDPQHVSVAQFRHLSARIALCEGGTNIGDLRRVKDDRELSAIESAATIADRALQSVVADGLCGRTEVEVRDRLDCVMRREGAEDVSFPTIVASGPNGSRPHHEPGDRMIASGDMVVVDMGAEVHGYRSDMTRTVAVGAVSGEMSAMFEAVREAQVAAVAAIRAGTAGRDVDRAARSVFERLGLEEEFLHGTGHGVGLAIHESPILGPSCALVLREGEVVTAEPGLYRGGVGGVRIEDLLVVTGDGCRALTQTPKDLSCPPSPRTI